MRSFCLSMWSVYMQKSSVFITIHMLHTSTARSLKGRSEEEGNISIEMMFYFNLSRANHNLITVPSDNLAYFLNPVVGKNSGQHHHSQLQLSACLHPKQSGTVKRSPDRSQPQPWWNWSQKWAPLAVWWRPCAPIRFCSSSSVLMQESLLLQLKKRHKIVFM